MMPSRELARIHYADSPTPTLNVALIYSWDRDSLDPVSGGSGLKDYVKNQVWQIFQSQPEVDRIVMVRANGPTFFLLRTTGNFWFDITGKQVTSEASE